MASKLSRSWSFFSGRGKHATHNFTNDDYYPYQPGTRSRINLEDRFRRDPPPVQKDLNNITGPEGGMIDRLQRDARFVEPRLDNPQAHHRSPAASAKHSLHPYQKRSPHSAAAFSTLRTEYDENAENLRKSPPLASINKTPPYGPYRSPSTHGPRHPFRRINSTVLWNNIQENVTQIKPQTTKLFKDGGNKMNKVVQGVRTSIVSFSQRFRNNTHRRYQLDGSETPIRGGPSRVRTPDKLYSPFNVSTPLTPYSHNKHPKRLQNHTPRRINYGQVNRSMGPITPQRNTHVSRSMSAVTPGHNRVIQQSYQQQQRQQQQLQNMTQNMTFDSPSRALQQDTRSLNQGIRELELLSEGMHNRNRRSFR